ncbi:acyltransferase [Aliarcobacter cryaerophilus]|uniref:acyltransferase family protein n=1 Tax=Aliarcobacter cryaerophilus TaxID=28198 RepID=UPI003DA4B816
MFGYLRFFLAYLVLLSHIQITLFSLNIGVFAVVIFYILAGYVVSNLYLNILANKENKTWAFYKDRIKRIFPLYLYTLSLTIIFLLLTNYANPIFNIQNIFSNLTIIPLNYYMYLDSTVLQNPSWALIPPAWSLGAELQAYILLSFVFIFKKSKYIFAAFTLFIYTIANFGILNPDYFGYRFIAGVFFIFLVGYTIQKIKSNKCEDSFDKFLPLVVFLISFVLYTIFYINNSFSPTYTQETLLGLLFGIPTIYILSKYRKKVKFDFLLGKLSYGVFLSHFLVIWVLDYYSFSKENIYYLPLLSFFSIFIAYIGTTLFEKSN